MQLKGVSNHWVLIHIDVYDLKYVQIPNANKYFITFRDDCMRYYYVYFLNRKDEALDKFIIYKNEVENQLRKKIKVVKSDRVSEYESLFGGYYGEQGIINQTTAPYYSQQNGAAEQKNHTLKDIMNVILSKFLIAPEHVGWSDSHCQLYLEYSTSQEVGRTPIWVV